MTQRWRFSVVIFSAVFFGTALTAGPAIAQKRPDPQKGVQGAFHWVEKPRIEFKPTSDQRKTIAEENRANKQRFTLALTREQSELFEKMFKVKVTETAVQRVKVPQPDLRVSIAADYIFEFPEMYYTECGMSGGKASCLTYQHAIQKEIIRGESRPAVQAIESLKVEPVYSPKQRETIASAFSKGMDEVTIDLNAKQNELFNRVFGAADRKKMTVRLMPVKPMEVRLKKNDELSAKGCGIKDWESWCDSVGCHMLCKPACD